MSDGITVDVGLRLGRLSSGYADSVGRYHLAGTAAVETAPGETTPGRYRIRATHLLSRRTYEIWSAADGTWMLDWLPPGEYLVVQHDHTRTHNAARADFVRAVLMPRFGPPAD